MPGPGKSRIAPFLLCPSKYFPEQRRRVSQVVEVEVAGAGNFVSTNYRSICHNMSLTFNVVMSIIE